VHELSLMKDVMAKIQAVADENEASRVTRVEVWLGALCHLSAPHFTEHFEAAARGTVAEGASLAIELSDDIHHPQAAAIFLRSVDVAP
jgi:hydrogenase nickel incorporation protein HypA/HybF